MRRAITAFVVGLSLLTFPAMAVEAPAAPGALSDAYNSQTDQNFRVGLQMRLAWAGDYHAAFSGDIDPASLRAIRDFQARHGMTADGVITEGFLRLLIVESDRAESAAGFSVVDDAATGVRIGLPLAFVRDDGPTDVGRVWRSQDAGIEIETVRIAGEGKTLAGLYDMLRTANETRSVTASTFGGDSFTVTGSEGSRAYVMRFAGRGSDLRGFAISYAEADAARMAPVVAVSANLFDPFGGNAGNPMVVAGLPRSKGLQSVLVQPREATIRDGAVGGDVASGAGRTTDGDGLDSSGSGFVVSNDGWLLTNAHVARSCKTVLVGTFGAADNVVLDETNDLALVHVPAAIGAPLPIAAGVPRLGEDILALGFPLRSILADSLNVTRGNVSSLMGLMNDPRYLQISAPVQPGNSGGPLVDLSGRVVGVVTAKLNAVAIADATGDIPQSINFAIRPDAVAAFLTKTGVAFTPAGMAGAPASVADTTAKVQDSVLPVLCLGGE